MALSHDVERAILGQLAWRRTCAFDELTGVLRPFTWNQVFDTVDRLSRTGKVSIQRPDRFGFTVSALRNEPRVRCG